MPSEISLQRSQYYANPNNVFWWIMGEILGFDVSLPYRRRVELVCGFGIAVWDVLHSCQREGSLDSNIQRESEIANNLFGLVSKNSDIKLIAFNGGAAKHIFMRHCSDIVSEFPDLELQQLPSTSPAYAAMPRTRKLEIWRSVIDARSLNS